MQTLIKRITFILILLFSACGTQSNESKSKDSLSNETFNEFFDKFRKDSLFQIERVKFPWIIPSENGESIVINKTQWLHANFDYHDSLAERKIDAYTQRISTYGDTVKIELRGVDNGLHIDFVFAKIHDKWFLYSEKDLSN